MLGDLSEQNQQSLHSSGWQGRPITNHKRNKSLNPYRAGLSKMLLKKTKQNREGKDMQFLDDVVRTGIEVMSK